MRITLRENEWKNDRKKAEIYHRMTKKDTKSSNQYNDFKRICTYYACRVAFQNHCNRECCQCLVATSNSMPLNEGCFDFSFPLIHSLCVFVNFHIEKLYEKKTHKSLHAGICTMLRSMCCHSLHSERKVYIGPCALCVCIVK